MKTDLRMRVDTALGDDRARANIRRAMDGLVEKRLRAFPSTDELARLRDQGQAIRAHALARLPELLEALERNCAANGIQVHWAETTDQANRIVLDLLRRIGAKALLKGKSMVSEEMGLNPFLQANGIEAIETDLGELIIQLAGETPSHIIAPAIHKDRAEIADLFRKHFPLRQSHPLPLDNRHAVAAARPDTRAIRPLDQDTRDARDCPPEPASHRGARRIHR